MSETIKGGAYQSPDGSWHDASGKPLPSSKIKEAEELAAQHAEELAATEAVDAGVSALTEPAPVVTKTTRGRQVTRKNKDKVDG